MVPNDQLSNKVFISFMESCEISINFSYVHMQTNGHFRYYVLVGTVSTYYIKIIIEEAMQSAFFKFRKATIFSDLQDIKVVQFLGTEFEFPS